MQVVVDDGRVIVGELTCLDKQANLILRNCHEELSADLQSSSYVENRLLVACELGG